MGAKGYAEDRSVVGVRKRRVGTTVAACLSLAGFILLFSGWARSVSTVDSVFVPTGNFTQVEAASGNGRLVFVVTRRSHSTVGFFRVDSRIAYPSRDAATMLSQSRLLYYTYFGRDTAGFIWLLDAYGVVFTIPYWCPVTLFALSSIWFTRLWWRRRIGRHW